MINIKKLNFKNNSNTILKDVDVSFPNGKITAVIGENGSGKSSLLKIMAGIWNYDDGNVFYGEDELSSNLIKIKEKTGFLFENPFFYENLTGIEFIEFVMSIRHKVLEKEKMDRFISVFSLEDYRNTPFNEMPKGIRQKFGIISALIHDPEIIFFDEPVNGLDPVSVKVLRELLKKEKENGKLIVISTHILELAEKLADRIVVIKDGKCIYQGDNEILFEREKENELEELFIKLTGGEKYRELFKLI